MQIIKTFLVAFIFILPSAVMGQSSLFQQGSKENILLERLEIKMQTDTVLNFSHIKPFNRKWWAGAILRTMDTARDLGLSKVDQYNVERAKINNLEWTSPNADFIKSRKSIFNSFYTDPANFIGINQKDFFLSVNPVLQLQAIKDDASDELLYLNTRGALVRSLVARKIGFQAYVTETQEKAPVFVQNQINQFRAVPGAGLNKIFKQTGRDYFDARGSVFFNAAKYLDFQFGYDKMFLGNGYRSLFISDYSNSHLFLNMNLKVWRLNYISRIMELQPQYTRRSLGADTLFSKKYMSLHYLSINAPKWLTLGFFEGVVFGRLNKFEFAYLNPVMLLRVAELQIGSPDNAFIGFDIKANIAKRVQVYGQVMLDEFYTRYIREKDGWWGNKWAFQGGLKYIDVAGVNNLDLQLETNWIRPFTYSHTDTVANYTHYNQPLAHPLMSNIKEFIFILRYQPAPKWYAQAKVIYWKSGNERIGQNYGSNIFLDSDTRSAEDGFFYGSPVVQQNLNTNLWTAYEIRENLFLEANISARKTGASPNNLFASLGLRWNMQRREYDY